MIHSSLFQSLPYIVSLVGEIPQGEFSVCTDSREFQPGEIFVGLKGEQFDGAHFLGEVLKKGPPLVVVDQTHLPSLPVQNLMKANPQTAFVFVEDTLKFYQALGNKHAEDWRKKGAKKGIKRYVIGITGSNGKTTNKEMLFHFLAQVFPGKVLGTEKNFNNQIGVPKTLLGLTQDHDLAVVEMGTNHPGEIAELCQIAQPDCGMITNIGAAHLEFFHTLENIFKEKGSLFDSVMETTQGQGAFVVNGDDPFLAKLRPFPGLLFFSEKPDAGKVHFHYGEKHLRFTLAGKDYFLQNDFLTGRHNFTNLGATFLLATRLFPEKAREFEQVASSFRPKRNRSEWLKVGKASIFLDAYNANPSSMRASLLGFIEHLQSQKVPLEEAYFILGDMNELGDHAEGCHRDLAKELRDWGLKNISFVGRYGKYYQQGFGEACTLVSTAESYKEKFKGQVLAQYSYIFLKGSRSLQLETLLDI